MGKVVVFGSANMDLVARVGRMPAAGETVLGDEFLTVFGGKGANEAVAAARLEAEVSLVASLGEDDFGRRYLAHLAAEGIDTSLVRLDGNRPTGCALITLDSAGENTIVVCPGANQSVTCDQVRTAGKAVASADIVLTQYEIPEPSVMEVIGLANSAGVPVMINVSPVPEKVAFEGGRVDYLLVNEVETARITGISGNDDQSLRKAASVLHGLGAGTVVVTRGADPTFVSAPGLQLLVPTVPVTPVDTVGAGDTFAGALATALSEGLPLQQAVEFANRAAALATTKVGAQTSMPARAQLSRLV